MANSSEETTPAPSTDGIDFQRLLNGLLAGSIITVNTATFVVILRTKVLKTKAKLMIGSLALTDKLFGVASLLPRVWGEDPPSRDPLCYTRFSSLFLSVYATALTVNLIALDRTIAVIRPQFHRAKVKAPVTAVGIVLVWIVSVLMVLPTLWGGFPPGASCSYPLYIVPGRGLAFLGAFLTVSCLAVFVLYSIIGWQLKKQMVRVVISSAQQAINRSDKHAAVTGLLLALVFLCGFLPVALYLLWVTQSGVDIMEERFSKRLYILVVCPNTCCILDPIVYFWRIREWHSALCNKCKRRPSTSSSGPVNVSLQCSAAPSQHIVSG